MFLLVMSLLPTTGSEGMVYSGCPLSVIHWSLTSISRGAISQYLIIIIIIIMRKFVFNVNISIKTWQKCVLCSDSSVLLLVYFKSIYNFFTSFIKSSYKLWQIFTHTDRVWTDPDGESSPSCTADSIRQCELTLMVSQVPVEQRTQ